MWVQNNQKKQEVVEVALLEQQTWLSLYKQDTIFKFITGLYENTWDI